MAHKEIPDLTPEAVAVETSADLALLLRRLRHREARQRDDSPWTYRELAAKTGWSLGSISRYLDGKVVPPTDRFDALVRLFGATVTEQGALATARDRVVENQRRVSGGAPAGARPIPRQLPSEVSGFVGRATQLAELDAIGKASGGGARAVVISAVHGTAGVGKTALAVHWAHRVSGSYPDGQLYINLRGFDPGEQSMDPREVLRRFLESLGVPAQRIPADADAQSALYRSELAGRRMLVVLDNARDTAQVRPLLPGGPTCLVIVTSRNHLSGLVAAHSAYPIALDLLTPDEARHLLGRRLGIGRLSAEPDAVHEIITACARLPLALAIVAARAATHPGLSLHSLAGELRDANARLDTLDTDDPAIGVRAVFSWSYHALTKRAATLFRLLGLHPGPEVSTAAVVSLAGTAHDQAQPSLTELVQAHLLQKLTADRYTFHDLLRAYASDLAHNLDPDERQNAARQRMLDHYLHTAYAADRLLEPAHEPITLMPPRAGVVPEHLADHAHAMAWFDQEHPVLISMIDSSAGAGFDSHTWRLASTLESVLDRRGRWHDLAAVQHAAATAAQRLDDLPLQAHAHRVAAVAYSKLGDIDQAHAHLRRAVDLYGQTRDLVGQAQTHLTLGMTWCRQGHHQQALDHAEQALSLFRAVGHEHGQAQALNSAGWYHALLGHHSQALTCCGQALAMLERFDNQPGQADAWDSQGYIYHQLGRHDDAIACYRHALALLRDLGHRYGQATTLTHIGDVHHAADDLRAAREMWQHALAILEQLGHSDADGVRAKLSALDTPG